MTNTSFRQTMAAAAAATLVLSAPFAASAQQQRHGQQQQSGQRNQSGQQQHSQPSGQSQHNQQQGGQHNGAGQSQQTGRYRITSTVNVRSGAGTTYRRVGQLRSGQVVQVDQVRNGWLHIQGRGWISASFARRA